MNNKLLKKGSALKGSADAFPGNIKFVQCV